MNQRLNESTISELVQQEAKKPVLYAIVCGSRPASNIATFVDFAQTQGWNACVVSTPDGVKFLDVPRLEEQTGHPVLSQYKQPSEPDGIPPADALVIAPATFNTINKWALGVSDTLALGLVNDAMGLGLPIIAVPWTKPSLAQHPAFSRSLATLRDCGVRIILDESPNSNAGKDQADFPWAELQTELSNLQLVNAQLLPRAFQ
jgi:phosphopantothenoylcysteine synthetase/decarboxylase